jgi:hypothetical protein
VRFNPHPPREVEVYRRRKREGGETGLNQLPAETHVDASTPPRCDVEPDRQWLLQQLRRILEIALERVTVPKTPSLDRIRWSRVVIAAGQACNSILRDVEIDALKQQISELKELTMAKLSDEQGEDQEGDTETSTDS